MKVLFVTQEMNPYTVLTEISNYFKKLPHKTQDSGNEIRVLMPRFGSINERRHRLHEVVRLSGMNIIVDDEDYPLIIKVASYPGARLQVYFLDNEEFFKRKFLFQDAKGKDYDDNQDRMVFFCKGVMEIVRKFGWPPDIIHCHGTMTSLVPLYAKKGYHTDPIFSHSKVLYSAYTDVLSQSFDKEFLNKAAINNLTPEDIEPFLEGDKINLHKGAMSFADAVLMGNPDIKTEVEQYTQKDQKLFDFVEEGDHNDAIYEFYQEFVEEEEEDTDS
jgi:starch synthase